MPHQARVAITTQFLREVLRPGEHPAYRIPEDGPIPADAVHIGTTFDPHRSLVALVFEHESLPEVPQGTAWEDLPVLGPIEMELVPCESPH